MLIKNAKDKLKGIHTHVLPALAHGEFGHKGGVNDGRGRYADALQQIDELRNELATQTETRFKEGFEAGKKMAYEETLAEMKDHVTSLGCAIAAVRDQQAHLVHSSREFVVDFALQIVDRMVGTEAVASLRVDRERLLEIVNEAVAHFADSAKFVFRGHPEMVVNLEDERDAIQANLPDGASFATVEDPSLKKCDCLVESDFGILDARIEAQLQQIGLVLHEKGGAE